MTYWTRMVDRARAATPRVVPLVPSTFAPAVDFQPAPSPLLETLVETERPSSVRHPHEESRAGSEIRTTSLPRPDTSGAQRPPATHVEAPPNHTPAPAIRFPTPVNALPAPAERLPTPVNGLPAPAERLPTPVNALPAPAERLPTPVNVFPASAERLPTPVNVFPASAERLPTPVNVFPASAERRPTPAVQDNAAQVMHSTPQRPSRVVEVPAHMDGGAVRAAGAPHPTATMNAPATPPVLRIHIGRVEVRAVTGAPHAAPAPVAPRNATTSLDDFLARKGGRR